MMKNMDMKTIKAGILYRHATLENVKDTNGEETRSFELSFSSEEPVERSFGIEILDHKPESVQLQWLKSGRAPLLLDHDPTKQIGVVETASIDGDLVARAKIRFSKNKLAQNVYQDVLDGIKSNISVGYKYTPTGVRLEKEGRDGQPNIYRICGWQPLEVSIVSIPADHSVGIGRSNNNNEETIFTVRSIMENTISTNNQETTNPNFNPEQIRQDETTRVAEILALGDRHKMSVSAMDFVKQGKSLDSFRSHVLENLYQLQ